MILSWFVPVVGAILGLCYGVHLELTSPNQLLRAQWQEFKSTYNKVYYDTNEDERRFQLFLATRYAVAEHNREQAHGLHSYRQAVNKFADIETSEFLGPPAHINLDDNRVINGALHHTKKYTNVGSRPVSLDWRQTRDVTPVKDQGTQCNSGYAFATIAGLESVYSIYKNKKNLSLSEQQIIDYDETSDGCKDGSIYSAANYLYLIKGSESGKTYPYNGNQAKCKYDNFRAAVPINCFVYGGLIILDEVAYSPDQTGIYVPDSLKQYSHGIYSNPDCTKAKTYHYALIIGYGTDDTDGDYWILKNSWGKKWGELGFFRMARNKNNMCDIATTRIQFC